jgi:diguanylate cyclase (GGDEF)-like protein/PAS domain S-box-containing protein
MTYPVEYLLKNIPLSAFIANSAGEIISLNEKMCKLIGEQPFKVNLSIESLFDMPSSKKLKSLISKGFEQEIRNPYATTFIKNTKGRCIQIEINGKKLDFGSNDLWIFIVSEVDKLKREIANLKIRATKDELTGVDNRWSFFQSLDEEIKKAKRFNQTISLLVFDIDHFKEINDSYGHPIGDQLLKFFTKKVTPYLRESDVFARIGGDEFALLMPHTNLGQANEVANRIYQKISLSSMKVGDKKLTLSISSGVASVTGKSSCRKKLIELSDAALYKAKFSGRNKIEVDWLNIA